MADSLGLRAFFVVFSGSGVGSDAVLFGSDFLLGKRFTVSSRFFANVLN